MNNKYNNMGNCLSTTLEAYGITLTHDINIDVRDTDVRDTNNNRIYTSATGFEPARQMPTDF